MIWCHAASVGESISLLPLISAIRQQNPDTEITFLVTTGTVTSAQLMHRRLDLQDLHQFIPLDHPLWIKRFLDHWQPDAVLWLESELWPNWMDALKERSIPAALVNARFSDRSTNRWINTNGWGADLLSAFTAILAQSDKDAENVTQLAHADANITSPGNLKYASPILPHCQDRIKTWSNAIADRPVLLYASTHEGEETIALSIHQELKQNHHDLLTIIVPRHPERGDQIRRSIDSHGLTCMQLSLGDQDLPNKDTECVLQKYEAVNDWHLVMTNPFQLLCQQL